MTSCLLWHRRLIHMSLRQRRRDSFITGGSYSILFPNRRFIRSPFISTWKIAIKKKLQQRKWCAAKVTQRTPFLFILFSLISLFPTQHNYSNTTNDDKIRKKTCYVVYKSFNPSIITQCMQDFISDAVCGNPITL